MGNVPDGTRVGIFSVDFLVLIIDVLLVTGSFSEVCVSSMAVAVALFVAASLVDKAL